MSSLIPKCMRSTFCDSHSETKLSASSLQQSFQEVHFFGSSHEAIGFSKNAGLQEKVFKGGYNGVRLG